MILIKSWFTKAKHKKINIKQEDSVLRTKGREF